MVVDPRAPTRKELERFLPDQRSVRAFEKLFELVPGSLVLENSVTIVGGSYTTEGNQTLICLAPADITLQSVNVKDAARVTIKRFNGEVKVFASTLIDGRTPPTILNRDLTSLDFYFSEPELAWFIT
jgi:hypothetical protein